MRNTLSAKKVLAPRAAPLIDEVEVAQVTGDGREARWWLIEAESEYISAVDPRIGAAFKLSVEWSFAGDSSQQVLVSVNRAVRVVVFGRAIKVRAGNVSTFENPIAVRWSPLEAPLPTRNVVDVRASLPVGTHEIPVPRFAQSVRLGVGDPAAKAGAAITLSDPFLGGVFDHVAYSDQPPEGVMLGDCDEAHVVLTAPSNVRLTFFLPF